jgi:hypothetical protein
MELRQLADHGFHAIYGIDLRLHACWDSGFKFVWGNVILSLVSVVFCQVAVSATS